MNNIILGLFSGGVIDKCDKEPHTVCMAIFHQGPRAVKKSPYYISELELIKYNIISDKDKNTEANL